MNEQDACVTKTATLSSPLSYNEFNRLSAFLHRFPKAMNLETMDGFFAAMICLPQTTTVNSVFSLVWGEEARFNTVEEAYEITNLIMRHWNTILQTLDRGDFHYPLLLEDRNGIVHANDWAHGFNMGMQFIYGNRMDALLNDQAYRRWILPILALAHEHNPDPEMRPSRIDNLQRQKLLFDLVIGVKKIHDYFRPQVKAARHKTIQIQQSKRVENKRREFCPCGSSRKYKQCCGNKIQPTLYSRTLH